MSFVYLSQFQKPVVRLRKGREMTADQLACEPKVLITSAWFEQSPVIRIPSPFARFSQKLPKPVLKTFSI